MPSDSCPRQTRPPDGGPETMRAAPRLGSPVPSSSTSRSRERPVQDRFRITGQTSSHRTGTGNTDHGKGVGCATTSRASLSPGRRRRDAHRCHGRSASHALAVGERSLEIRRRTSGSALWLPAAERGYGFPSWKKTRATTVGVRSVVCTGTMRSTVRPRARASLSSVIFTADAAVPAPYVWSST